MSGWNEGSDAGGQRPGGGEPEGGRVLAARYHLVGLLGHGGMGTVWRAEDQLLGREVAVKELTVRGLPAAELRVLQHRMEQEARAAARVRHPAVVTVFDVLEEDGRPWIVMELVDGRSLAEIVDTEGTLLPRDAARVGAQLLSALDRAHQLGVLHRDIKPANILLERGGRVVLTDFGIALVDGAPGLTRTGDVVGSPDYLAPERVTGHRPGPESDLWSLGATLYAAVEGQSPFRRATTLSTMQAIVADPLPEPRQAGPLAPVIGALLDKDPARRPTAEQARRALEAIAAGAPPGPEPAFATTRTTAVPSPGHFTPYTSRSTPPTAVTGPLPPPPASPPARRGFPVLPILAAALAAAVLAGGVSYAVLSGHRTASLRTTAAPVGPTGSGTPGTGGGPQPSTATTGAAAPGTTAAAPGTTADVPGGPGTAPSSTAADPAAVVTAYFAAINAHDYQRAWDLGGKNVQNGTYASFVQGFDGTASDTATITSVTQDSVTVQLDAAQTDGSHQHYSGTYTVQDGVITGAAVSPMP